MRLHGQSVLFSDSTYGSPEAAFEAAIQRLEALLRTRGPNPRMPRYCYSERQSKQVQTGIHGLRFVWRRNRQRKVAELQIEVARWTKENPRPPIKLYVATENTLTTDKLATVLERAAKLRAYISYLIRVGRADDLGKLTSRAVPEHFKTPFDCAGYLVPTLTELFELRDEQLGAPDPESKFVEKEPGIYRDRARRRWIVELPGRKKTIFKDIDYGGVEFSLEEARYWRDELMAAPEAKAFVIPD